TTRPTAAAAAATTSPARSLGDKLEITDHDLDVLAVGRWAVEAPQVHAERQRLLRDVRRRILRRVRPALDQPCGAVDGLQAAEQRIGDAAARPVKARRRQRF